MILMGDDAYRTHPPEPTVKILKRPSKSPHSSLMPEVKPKAPIKTLQQREQEYAEARLRILGSAKSPEEITECRYILFYLYRQTTCSSIL